MQNLNIPRIHKLGYFSSYDRGLIHLLKMWPDIKKEVPDATLDICYGWVLFEKGYANNPERMSWMERMKELMKQDGITEHGRVGQDKLQEIRRECGIWAYPTDFCETNCITALQSQNDGLVPVVMNLAGLKETVGSGIRLEGDIYVKEDKEKYKEELIAMMKDEERWKVESEKAQEFAKSFYWENLAKKWQEQF